MNNTVGRQPVNAGKTTKLKQKSLKCKIYVKLKSKEETERKRQRGPLAV